MKGSMVTDHACTLHFWWSTTDSSKVIEFNTKFSTFQNSNTIIVQFKVLFSEVQKYRTLAEVNTTRKSWHTTLISPLNLSHEIWQYFCLATSHSTKNDFEGKNDWFRFFLNKNNKIEIHNFVSQFLETIESCWPYNRTVN